MSVLLSRNIQDFVVFIKFLFIRSSPKVNTFICREKPERRRLCLRGPGLQKTWLLPQPFWHLMIHPTFLEKHLWLPEGCLPGYNPFPDFTLWWSFVAAANTCRVSRTSFCRQSRIRHAVINHSTIWSWRYWIYFVPA